ncbi:MAG: hypothetical protein PHC85_00830 [Candidatus Pacebacteria bacterium]|nr:hypothetical protein [Candidatus Paceibacterota bacterium]
MLDKNYKITRKGGLYINTPIENSDIYINLKKEKTTSFLNRDLLMSNIEPKKYSILIAKEGYWPWAKTIEVKPGMVIEARAIMVKENPQGEFILKGKFSRIWSSPSEKIIALKEEKNGVFDLLFYLPENNVFLTPLNSSSKYLLSFKKEISGVSFENGSVSFKTEKGNIKADFDFSKNSVSATQTDVLPEKSDYEKTARRGQEKISWNPETNEVFVEWLEKNSTPPQYICEEKCESPIKIFKSFLKLRNADFFPGRPDVATIAVGNGIYALEIDGRGGRLIYPLYKGKEPDFALLGSEKNVYIIDDGSLIKISLE